mgnify:CR=1 FL=1
MKLKTASPEYLEKAAALTREDAERLFSRMRGKLIRKLEHDKIESLEAVALQLQLEDEDLNEWRQRWAEISEREGEVYDTELGRIGLLSCMDGLIPETARVLAGDPDWILADEPLANLDPPHARDVEHLLRDAADGGVTPAETVPVAA